MHFFYSLSLLLLRYHSQYCEFIFIIRINYYETDNWNFKILKKDSTNDMNPG